MPMMSNEHLTLSSKDLDIYKIVIIGDSGTGKSSIMKRFVDNEYSPNYICTIGVDFKIKTLLVGDIYTKLQIWDTSGQERFRTITKAYYRGSNCIIIVYDTTDRETFESVKFWLEEVDLHTDLDTLKILVGTKIDHDKKIVDTSEGSSLAKKFDMFFVECSAKNDINIESIFILAICQIRLRQPPKEIPESVKSVNISLKTEVIEDENCC